MDSDNMRTFYVGVIQHSPTNSVVLDFGGKKIHASPVLYQFSAMGKALSTLGSDGQTVNEA